MIAGTPEFDTVSEMRPPLVVVGLSNVVNHLKTAVIAVESVGAARPLLAEGGTLVLSDTALAGEPVWISDTLRDVANRGSRVVVVRSTFSPDNLTWDTPNAIELSLPSSVSDLAEVVGLIVAEDGPIVADETLELHVPRTQPVVAWKRGQLHLALDGELLVAGAFAGDPVPMACDALVETPGFYAFVERHQAEGAFLGAALLTVHLSGHVRRLVTMRADGNGFVATRQEVASVELSPLCQRKCYAPATKIALFPREGTNQIVVTCTEHAEGYDTISVTELQSRLEAAGVVLGPRQRPQMAKLLPPPDRDPDLLS
jgi:hypothetical protein